MKRTGSGGNQVMEKENNMRKDIKRTVAGFLAGINMMIPGAGAAASEEPTPEEIKSPAGVCDVLKGETEKGELEKLEEIEVNQRFSEFLNGEGGYSDETLKKRMFCYYSSISKAELGFCGLNGIETVVQGVLLGHFFKDDGDYVAVGVKNRDGKRIISLAEWPIKEEMKAYNDVIVVEMVGGGSSTSYAIKSLVDRDEVDFFINEKMGQVVLFNFFNLTDKDLKSKGFKSLDSEKANFYLNFVLPKISDNTEFIAGLWMPQNNDRKKMRPEEIRYMNNLRKSNGIEGVDNYSDVQVLLNSNANNLPLISYIAYNKYVH